MIEQLVNRIHSNGNLYSGSDSELLFVVQRYLPVANIEDDVLESQFTKVDLAWLTLDTGKPVEHCEIYTDDEEESGEVFYEIDQAHYSLVTFREGFRTEGLDFDSSHEVSEPGEDEGEQDGHDYNCGQFWEEIFKDCGRCICAFGERRAQERQARRDSRRPSEESNFLAAINDPKDADYLLKDVMGADHNGFTLPVQTLTPVGLQNFKDVYDPTLGHESLLLVPLRAGWSAHNRRYGWFGRKMKALNYKEPKGDTFCMSLGDVQNMLSEHISETIGEHALSARAVRPLAKAHIQLGENSAVADAYPVTKYVFLAVARPQLLAAGLVVRGFTNWSRGNLGRLSNARTGVSSAMMNLLLKAPKKSAPGHIRHIDFMWKGCPEPMVCLSDRIINKLLKVAERKTMEEEITLIVLEGDI